MKFIFTLIIAFLFISCNTYFDIDRKFIFDHTHESTKYKSKFKKDSRGLLKDYVYKDTKDSDRTYNWYKIGDLYYIYEWRITINKPEYQNRKRSEKYMDDVFFEETNLLILYDIGEGSVKLFDSIYFYKPNSHLFFETKNFYYLPTIVSGYPEFWEDPPSNLVSGVLMVTKKGIERPYQSKYINEEVIYVIEETGNLRIVTTKVKPKVFIMDYLFHQLVVHQSIGNFVSMFEYTEYIYDNDLNLISKKDLKSFDYK